jgi:hypothetical protein
MRPDTVPHKDSMPAEKERVTHVLYVDDSVRRTLTPAPIGANERRFPPPWEGEGWSRGEARRGALRGTTTVLFPKVCPAVAPPS